MPINLDVSLKPGRLRNVCFFIYFKEKIKDGYNRTNLKKRSFYLYCLKGV